MSITIFEFREAMKIYGDRAKRIPDEMGSRYNVNVPCFEIAGITFKHSANGYIIQTGEKKIPDEIMDQAMGVFDEKYPGRNHYWHEEIHTVAGMLTLAAMLDGKYSKEFVNELIDETYKKLIKRIDISNYEEISIYSSTEIKHLYELLQIFKQLVNPFGNLTGNFKNPAEYIDKVELNINLIKGENGFSELTMESNSCNTSCNNHEGAHYWVNFNTQRYRRNGRAGISYHATDTDSVVHIWYNANKEPLYDRKPEDLDLWISLITGKAWTTYKEKKAKMVTKEQIKLMKRFLKKGIRKIKKEIIRYIK